MVTTRFLSIVVLCCWALCVLTAGGRKRKGKQNLEIFPLLAYDDWNTGHELPDVVEGRVFGGIIFLRVVNRGRRNVKGVRLAVKGSRFILPTVSEVPIDVKAGQRVSLHAPLRQVNGTSIPQEACPFKVRLEVNIGDTAATGKYYKLLCRTIHDRITFVFLDVDGSPQIAAAKFPKVSSKYGNRTGCPEDGCAVLLSTHGMDVTAQRQADCYRPKPDLWVLAPHGRGTHATNWQGPGHWHALRALRSLSELAARWTFDRVTVANRPWKVIFTGHSNGGFGAWFFGAHYPDMAVGVATLAGMATLGTTEMQKPAEVHGQMEQIWKVVDSSVTEYRGDAVVKNLLNLPFFARTGLQDRVIDPRATKHMGTLFASAGVTWSENKIKKPRGVLWKAIAGVEKRIVFLEGKEHWWWDTVHTNDGGAVDDGQLRKFWKRVLRKGESKDRKYEQPVYFSCANPVSCGSSAGVRVLAQQVPGQMSSFEMSYSKEFLTINIQTVNVARLRILNLNQYMGSFKKVVLDGQSFELLKTKKRDYGDYVRKEQVGREWTDDLRKEGRRSDDIERNSGPVRRVFAAPFAIVYGTTGVAKVTRHYKQEAIKFANSWATVVGGSVPVVSDKKLVHLDTVLAQNVILFGGKQSNSVSRSVLFPFRSIRSKDIQSQIEGGFGISKHCSFTEPGVAIVSIGPRVPGLAAIVAGTTLSGFDKAVELLRSNMFQTNSWQHRLPDFVIAGKGYKTGRGGATSLAGVVAAGFWGDQWEYLPNASASMHGNCNL